MSAPITSFADLLQALRNGADLVRKEPAANAPASTEPRFVVRHPRHPGETRVTYRMAMDAIGQQYVGEGLKRAGEQLYHPTIKARGRSPGNKPQGDQR